MKRVCMSEQRVALKKGMQKSKYLRKTGNKGGISNDN